LTSLLCNDIDAARHISLEGVTEDPFHLLSLGICAFLEASFATEVGADRTIRNRLLRLLLTVHLFSRFAYESLKAPSSRQQHRRAQQPRFFHSHHRRPSLLFFSAPSCNLEDSHSTNPVVTLIISSTGFGYAL
jgi:hypothetical protein